MAASLLKQTEKLSRFIPFSSRMISEMLSNRSLTRDKIFTPAVFTFFSRTKTKMVYKRSGPPLPKRPPIKPDIKALLAEDTVSEENMEEIMSQQFVKQTDDMPLDDLPNPYKESYHKCFLCNHRVELDYKNVQLLSQFVSPHTGHIYGRHITGLCIPMQRRIAKLVKRSRYFGFMPYVMKDPNYLEDPKLFDPFRRMKRVPTEQ